MLTEGPDIGNAPATQRQKGTLPLLVVFLLSGASGLIYEVVWSRALVLVFGSTTHAVSTVLAAFMGGLALGSILVGRRGDRLRHPLRVYAWIEVAIAVTALAVLALLPAMVPIYRLLWGVVGDSPTGVTTLRFVLACLVLLPPTTLMGATLPILSAYLERAGQASSGLQETAARDRGTGAGALYAANTLGAVAGVAAAGFLLLPALGMRASALAAAACNLIAAAAAFRLARRSDHLPCASVSAVSHEGEATSPSATAPVPAGHPVVLMVAFGISGAGALIFEVVWTRVLSLVLGSSTQAFTIMLTTFLAGLALGSAAATRLLRRLPDPILAFALTEVAAGAWAFFGIRLFPELPYTFVELFRAAGGPTPLFHAGRFLIAALVMLPPTLFLGAAFPLAARAALAVRSTVSDQVASLYTANTVGAILGSCAAGFLLIPAFGLQNTLVAGCMAVLAAGAVLLAAAPSARPLPRHVLAAALLVSVLVLPGATPPWNSAAMTSGVFQYAPHYIQQFKSRSEFLQYHASQGELFYKDGPTTTVSVERRSERINGEINTVLSVNGKVDASSAGDTDTQVLLGQLPLLAARRAGSVLVIGMGSGVTAGSALTHPVSSLAIVEIEPAIIEAQTFFENVNGRPLMDPRTTVRINDARNDLLMSDETYDVIISEPSNPWITGPSRLFTREFFELARTRLNPGGLLCQWVQLYGLDHDALATILRTYAAVFPHRLVFKGSPGDLLILGSTGPINLDVEEIASRMKNPPVAADLARIDVAEPADLFSRFRLDDNGIEAYISMGSASAGPGHDDGLLNTDDNAKVEFAAARTLYQQDHEANDHEIAQVACSILPHLGFLPGSRENGAISVSSAIARRLIRSGLLEKAEALIVAAQTLPAATPREKADLMAARGALLHKKGDIEGARRVWSEALALDPLQRRATHGLASLMLSAGAIEDASALLRGAADDPLCRILLGKARFLAGDYHGVLSTLEELSDPAAGGRRLDPDAGPMMNLYRGRAMLATGDPEGAVRELRAYFEQHPGAPRPAETSIDAATDLARAWLALGKTSEAIAQFRVVAGLADSLASWNVRQAREALRRKDPASASRSLRAALGWNTQDGGARRLLAHVLTDLGQYDEALAAWRDLDHSSLGDPEALRNIAALSMRMRRPGDAAAAYRRLEGIEGDPAVIEALQAAIRKLEGGT
jgi:spermidine synthase